MFETAELGRSVDKSTYKEQVEALRTELLDLQQQLSQADFPALVLVNGVDGAGKGEIVSLLNEWMDARLIDTVAIEATEEAEHRPLYWRYWMKLPPRGRMTIFTGAWYTEPIVQRAYRKTTDHDLDAAMVRVRAFEKTLVDDGALIIKLWLHISKERQKKRFKKLEKNPETRWRVTKRDWRHAKLYDRFRRICERSIRETSTGEAPWFVVESTDARYRNVTVATTIAEAVRRRLAATEPQHVPQPLPSIEDPETILDTIDTSKTLDKSEYRTRLERLQHRLNELARKAAKRKKGVILVFEGMDAAGKGGAIRRVTAALDLRQCDVIQVAAPTDEEKAHHYLWRFWRHLPRLGRFTIYDRSWYGRVLVERVEGFAPEPAWMRSYKEINDFEEQLVEHGIVLCKFWLHISSEEQLRRFEAREQTPYKQYKITDEDYRNRDKANQYEAAANEMIERTSTEYAPWTLVSSEDKRWGRIDVLQTVCDRLQAALEVNSR